MVVVLEAAAEDIESARRFYESCEAGVGDYFAEPILSDLDSLVYYAPAFIPSILDPGCSPIDFPSESTMRLKVTWGTFMPSWI
jgi:hypothetical protein